MENLILGLLLLSGWYTPVCSLRRQSSFDWLGKQLTS